MKISWLCAPFTLLCILVACSGGSDDPAPDTSPRAGAGGAAGKGAGGAGKGTGGAQASGGAAGGAGPEGGLPCEVQSLLAQRCHSCHSDPTSYGAPMPLLTRADLLAKPLSGDSATVGERAVARMKDDAKPMPQPPNPRATEAEIAYFKAWVDAGMPASTASCGGSGGAGQAGAGQAGAGMGGAGASAGGAGQGGAGQGGAGQGGAVSGKCTPDAEVKASTPWTIKQSEPDRYVCFGGKLAATGKKRQITEVSVKIDNTAHTHHICVYDTGDKVIPTTPEPCGAGSASSYGKLLYCWAPGADPNTLPKEAGFPLDATKDANIVVEMHYSNIQGKPDSVDNSAATFCTTDELRPYDADVMAFGSSSFSLPPNQSTTVESSVVAPEGLLPGGWIRVIRGWPHMHLLGAAQSTEVIRAGNVAGDLGSTKAYGFYNQIGYPVDVQILPGDEIRTKCVFKNNTSDSVSYGENTQSEMCYNFVTYYPRITAPDWAWMTPSTSSTTKVYPTP